MGNHAGIEQVLIVTSNSKSSILDYFDQSIHLENYLKRKNKEYLIKHLELPKIDICYIRQPYAKGLGDAIRLGKVFVGNDPFGILLPDDFVISDQTFALKQLIDVYQETKRSVIGRYIFTPEIFQCLENIKEGVDEEIHLTDAINGLLKEQTINGKIISGERYDIGNLEEYIELMKIMSKI
ncbi:hypothetical protein J1P26_19360 [Neobacillus sp. MM2021_6]|uniref:sugar phosphate nucleotidyltransferase n=1 Tax=Bacillaceae TaxID=186817 RepID=UPI00140E237D|nr:MULTISPECIES: sugar phosphate nucleotidyltransferase [Bacillaceae]MBO0961868.1 hypothetical protein [Neobacillus sp. MM2021_6]NHC18965.1 hypothetical protein [Bacillus sp. MM2020_4]